MSCRTSQHVLAGERKSDTRYMVIDILNILHIFKYIVLDSESTRSKGMEHKFN